MIIGYLGIYFICKFYASSKCPFRHSAEILANTRYR